MNTDIIYEDNHLLIVNKPSGILTQNDRTGDISILDFYKSYIKEKYHKPGEVFLAPAHRLDRPVSGCLILGRTSKALSRLSDQIRRRSITKTYLMLTRGNPPAYEDTLVDYLVKDTRTNRSKVVKSSHPGAKLSKLSYRQRGKINDLTLLEILLETGRSHQIRVQMSHIDCPVLGDQKYGDRRNSTSASMSLHCWRLKLIHPVRKEEMIVTAPFPDDHQSWKHFTDLI